MKVDEDVKAVGEEMSMDTEEEEVRNKFLEPSYHLFYISLPAFFGDEQSFHTVSGAGSYPFAHQDQEERIYGWRACWQQEKEEGPYGLEISTLDASSASVRIKTLVWGWYHMQHP